MQGTTVSVASGRFFRDLKAFARDAESSCKDLKTNLERPALSALEGGNSAQILVESIALQVDDLINEVDQLTSCQGFNGATEHLSLEVLFKRCLAVYNKNEELKEELETKLEQYSYQRKDPTKQKAGLQSSKIPQPTTSKLPVKSSSQSNIPKPSLNSSLTTTTTTKSTIPTTSNTSNTSNTVNTLNASNLSNPANASTIAQAIPSQPLSIPTDTKHPETSKTTQPSPPHTPPKQKNLFDDFPRTPTLDDVGISASALELIAKDQVKKQKKASLTKEPSNLSGVGFNFTATFTEDTNRKRKRETTIPKEETTTERKESTTSSRSSTSSVEDGNFISERKRTKTKKHKDKSNKAPDTMFPLMEEIRQEEYNAITPEYLKLSFSFEQLNKAVSKINEHMTDKRFAMEGASEGAMESFTEADLRDDMEFGVKAKSVVLLLIHLKRIALDKRFGGTRLKILEKADK